MSTENQSDVDFTDSFKIQSFKNEITYLSRFLGFFLSTLTNSFL